MIVPLAGRSIRHQNTELLIIDHDFFEIQGSRTDNHIIHGFEGVSLKQANFDPNILFVKEAVPTHREFCRLCKFGAVQSIVEPFITTATRNTHVRERVVPRRCLRCLRDLDAVVGRRTNVGVVHGGLVVELRICVSPSQEVSGGRDRCCLDCCRNTA